MPNLGPEYDAAVRLRAVEERLARLEANPYGQLFSATQSDGSVGMQISQNAGGAGATAMVFYQGPTTSRDPSTNQHPTLLYVGELFSGGVSIDSGARWNRPDGSAAEVIGNRGVQIYDPHGHQVIATDEYGASPSGQGLNSPWVGYGPVVSNNALNWLNTTSSSLVNIGQLAFPAQHANIAWSGSAYCPAGTTGQVQVALNSGATSAVKSVAAGGFTTIDDTLALGTWSFQQVLTLSLAAAVTSGPGPIYTQIFGVWGKGSGLV